MAIGSMAIERFRKMTNHCTVFIACCCMLGSPVFAQEVGLAGVLGSKALLIVNGGEPQAVPVGQTIDGVKVIAIQGDHVIVDIGGKKRPLKIGQRAIGNSSGGGAERITMTADASGHFYTMGSINGTSVRFIVDTGATMISLGASDARRIGLDFKGGLKGMTNTANGQAIVSKVTLDTVRVGGITLHNVDALIHQTEMPIALLGMSFLNRMEMQREGDTMTLKKRF